MDEERYSVKFRLHAITGELNYALECFGDELARREGYKELDGMEAIWLYLIKKYCWLPSQVRAMHPDDIKFVLTEEMYGWTLPEKAIVAKSAASKK